MTDFNLADHPHRRYNPLTGEWILVSPHRAKRPWQGQQEKVVEDDKLKYEEKCYLCPTNKRMGGDHNPDYDGAYVFQNDFGALLPDTPNNTFENDDIFKVESEKGICRVICYSPRHDLTIPEMETSAIRKVVDLWQQQFNELKSKDFINYVQIFENKGSVMGCSNPHPHGQIWSQLSIPNEIEKKTKMQEAYFEKHGTSLLSDYLAKEEEKKERIVVENEHFVALVPFWAVWPFETIVVSRRHFQDISQMTDDEKDGLADIYKKLTIKYDNLFEISFPYSAGIHQSPTDGENHDGWHFHMNFYPPLLRSATVKKFMVGYEMLATPQRDITAETAADRLKNLPDIHYKNK